MHEYTLLTSMIIGYSFLIYAVLNLDEATTYAKSKGWL